MRGGEIETLRGGEMETLRGGEIETLSGGEMETLRGGEWVRMRKEDDEIDQVTYGIGSLSNGVPGCDGYL